MNHLVKIIDPEHALYDQVLPGYCIYYDIHHTGESPDLYQVGRLNLMVAEKQERRFFSQMFNC